MDTGEQYFLNKKGPAFWAGHTLDRYSLLLELESYGSAFDSLRLPIVTIQSTTVEHPPLLRISLSIYLIFEDNRCHAGTAAFETERGINDLDDPQDASLLHLLHRHSLVAGEFLLRCRYGGSQLSLDVSPKTR